MTALVLFFWIVKVRNFIIDPRNNEIGLLPFDSGNKILIDGNLFIK